jgi:hypothetical protein
MDGENVATKRVDARTSSFVPFMYFTGTSSDAVLSSFLLGVKRFLLGDARHFANGDE